MTLEEIADIVTIAVPTAGFITWLVARKWFADFWKKRRKPIVAVGLMVPGILFLWRLNWLDWLVNRLTFPVWGLVLYSVVIICVSVVVTCFLLSVLAEKPPHHFTLYGARWVRSEYSKEFLRPPLCETCLMEMRNLAMPSRPFMAGDTERWVCRQCGHRIEWNCYMNGDLIEDVSARYNAQLRCRWESNTDQRP